MDSDHDAGSAAVGEELKRSVDTRLLELLFSAGPRIIAASVVVAAVVVLALRAAVPGSSLLLWSGLFLLVLVLRFLLMIRWRRADAAARRSPHWLWLYTLGTLAAGSLWGSAVLFLSSEMSLSHQLFVLVALVGLPIAAMPGDSVFMRVYYAFALPIVAGLLYWALFASQTQQLSIHFSLLVAAYAAVLWVTAHSYHDRLRQSIEMGLKNEQLVRQLSRSNRQLEQLAYLDPLTGLSNRRWFQLEAQQELDRGARSNRRLALLLIDLDNFKQVNDTLGHEMGDQLLQVTARRLTESLRHTDALARNLSDAARFGGDEFTVLLEDVDDRQGVEQAAARLIETLSATVMLGDVEWRPSASIGIALYPEHASRLGELMRGADVAMYIAKKRGRNRYCFFEPDRDGLS